MGDTWLKARTCPNFLKGHPFRTDLYGDLPPLTVLRQFQDIGILIILGNRVPPPLLRFPNYNKHFVIKHLVIKSIIMECDRLTYDVFPNYNYKKIIKSLINYKCDRGLIT